MKKRKYIFISILSIIVLGIIGYEIYWYNRLNGMNVPIIISTQYSPTPTSVAIYIDDKLIFKDNALQTLYTSLDISVPCGFHELKAIIDNEEFIETFFVLPVRWIYLEIQKDDSTDYKVTDDWVIMDFSFSPIILM